MLSVCELIGRCQNAPCRNETKMGYLSHSFVTLIPHSNHNFKKFLFHLHTFLFHFHTFLYHFHTFLFHLHSGLMIRP